jgi:hypothetical protein
MSASTCTSCLVAFDPGPSAAALAPGASTVVTFKGTTTATSSYVTLTSVDGDASGVPGSAWPNDGVDRIARAAASAAVSLLIDYENTKLPNTSPADANYAVYDGLLLSAHMFTLDPNSNGIIFDPNAPGYSFISTETQNLLAALQSNPEIATYLGVGLQSCFANVNGTEIYTVKAAPFKGFTDAGTSGAWVSTPGGASGTTDQYQLSSAKDPTSPGSNLITLNLKTVGDTQFGAAYATASTTSLVSSAVTAKFTTVHSNHGTGGGQSAACTPFNGPGGIANPHFVVSLSQNGGTSTTAPAYLQNQASNCTNSCTASLVVDPLAYQTPPASGSSVGSTSNPFGYDPTSNWSIGSFQGAYATYLNSSGTSVLGTFSVAQTVTNPKTKVTTATGNYIWAACSGKPAPGC